MHARFRPVTPEDRADIQSISDATWEGEDFLARVFDAWVADPQAHFVGLEQEGHLVGCGRLLPFDRRRAWLEGLRVHPRAQGRGLGREMAHHVFRLGRELGFDVLYFSTYFRNDASIRISEAAGFRRIAVFSLLETSLAPSLAPAQGDSGTGSDAHDSAPPAGAVRGYRSFPGWTWNDWLFVPEGLEGAERFFPNAFVVTAGQVRMLLADNPKWPDLFLKICALDGPPEADLGPCLQSVMAEARRLGRKKLHLMLPAARPIEAFRASGFRSYEQAEDVFLYEGRTAELHFIS